ncbi:RNA polymerase sigma factor [Hymenobacter ginsengisoli]|uniref:RNA polymerase sigma factor n=1 Tax=Hymenobacter ginsengisoli TaxID=1051626 RepID=A0ABP8QQ29_9BACT|nr:MULTISPECIES: RNA polymerase sigma factor [unclassified Hymenobacter]MBO2032950.1 RNA polymerase sigma factor [Hymenobacter sp. BT559]
MAYCLPLPATLAESPTPSAGAADTELVAQLQQGSEAAFRTLVARFQGRVYSTAYSLLRSAEEAEDVAQEVFVEVYQTIGRFRGEATLSTWLYRLATSRALQHRRRQNARKRFAFFTNLLGLTNEVLHEPPDHAHPQALLEGVQQLQQLYLHIGRLPGQQQVAFTLRYEQDLRYDEIAAVLGTTVPAVESLLYRARHTLRQHLQPASRHA